MTGVLTIEACLKIGGHCWRTVDNWERLGYVPQGLLKEVAADVWQQHAGTTPLHSPLPALSSRPERRGPGAGALVGRRPGGGVRRMIAPPTSLCDTCGHVRFEHYLAVDGRFTPKPGPCQVKPKDEARRGPDGRCKCDGFRYRVPRRRAR